MIELLAPAGSPESLRAAVNAGADAVYMGGPRFGARAYADNPQEDKFIEGIRYAHRYGVRVYMTVNTLLKPREIDELIDYIEPYYLAGVDAVLVQDLGVLKLLHTHFPDLPLHASTQMTVANVYSAGLLKECGITRVVPARELSLTEVRRIREESGLEMETFVHGALCYCYSGQCLMSSLIGGRSGNRGRCAQPCRLEYQCDMKQNGQDDARHGSDAQGSGGNPGRKSRVSMSCRSDLLSLRDLCSIELLPQLAAAGIDSFKIEGRMRSPRYTAGVTSVWRKYIDLYQSGGPYRVAPEDAEMLMNLYNRGEFTDGYYFRHNGPEMMSWTGRVRRENAEDLYAFLDEKYVNSIRKISLKGKVILRQGRETQMSAELSDHRNGRNTTSDGNRNGGEVRQEAASRDETDGRPGTNCRVGKKTVVTFTGVQPDAAVKKALTAEDIRRQMMKTGGTPYEFSELEIDTDGMSFVPVSVMNAMRRELLQRVEEVMQSAFQRSR